MKFYINKNRRCAQTAIKSVIEENISFEKLDKLTGREGNQITTLPQIAYCLDKLGVKFIYPVKPLFVFKQKIDLKKFGRQLGNDNYKRINFDSLEESISKLKEFKKYFLTNNFGLNDIEQEIRNNKIPICLINYDIFVGRENNYNGHYIIIHEIEEDYSQIMDSGPCGASPNKKISRKRLEDSLMQTPIDYGVIALPA